MKISHKQKIKKAKRMLTNEEIRNHTPLFSSKAWMNMRNSHLARNIERINKKSETINQQSRINSKRLSGLMWISKMWEWLKSKILYNKS